MCRHKKKRSIPLLEQQPVTSCQLAAKKQTSKPTLKKLHYVCNLQRFAVGHFLVCSTKPLTLVQNTHSSECVHQCWVPRCSLGARLHQRSECRPAAQDIQQLEEGGPAQLLHQQPWRRSVAARVVVATRDSRPATAFMVITSGWRDPRCGREHPPASGSRR